MEALLGGLSSLDKVAQAQFQQWNNGLYFTRFKFLAHFALSPTVDSDRDGIWRRSVEYQFHEACYYPCKTVLKKIFLFSINRIGIVRFSF